MHFKNQTEHLFFDLDHTLWDFEANSKLTFQKLFALHKMNIELEEFLKVYIPLNHRYWKKYREGEIDKSYLRFHRLNEVFRKLKYSVSDQLINQLSEDYINYLSSYTVLFPQTLETLTALKGDYKLHIITNGFDEVQYKKLKNSGLLHFFEIIVTSENTGTKKPNPIIFEHALQLAKANPQNSIMIGDNVEADIEGAENCGISTILFDPENKHNMHQGMRIQHIHELLHLL